jgi:glycosyltransferase involved in cell wall biosynthesis
MGAANVQGRMEPPAVSVVVPTRGRAGYLEVALDSLQSQEGAPPHELLVVDDGSIDATKGVLERRGLRSLRLPPPGGLNAARNAGVGATSSELVAFVDDDVQVPPGWLRAVVEGAARHPEAEAFGGPIRARFEGPVPRGCGREDPPLTVIDLGSEDRPCELVWGANMAVRRSAFDRVGRFDEEIEGGGDEEEWLERLQAAGGRIYYLAGAGLDHRRVGDDARLRSLMRDAYRRGRALRAFDARRRRAPGLGRELRVLAGCGWHTLRRACPQGIVMGAHSVGRTVEAVRPR